MDELPLRRDVNGEIQLAGTGAVTLRIVYDSVLGTGEHVIVVWGEILGRYDSRLIMKVSDNSSCVCISKMIEDVDS